MFNLKIHVKKAKRKKTKRQTNVFLHFRPQNSWKKDKNAKKSFQILEKKAEANISKKACKKKAEIKKCKKKDAIKVTCSVYNNNI